MFGSKKQHGTPIAVFDVSSSSVGGAHALIHHDKPPIMLASMRVEAPLQEDLDMKRFVTGTVKNLTSVAEKLQKADAHPPHRIELVLASPWYVSQTRTISYKKETPFIASKKFVASLVDAEIQHMIKNELERFGSFGKEGTVVEKQISLIKLNGYTTNDPFGKKARTIDIFLTVTVVPRAIIDEFRDVLYRSYGSRKINVTTSPYTTFVVARDYFDAGHECVIIDVGEEVTDVAFVKDGLFLYQHSFPVGTYGLYRAVMGNEKHTQSEAKAIVESYRLGKVSATVKARIDKSVAEFSSKWQVALQGILSEGYFGFCLPDTCYITADPRFEGVFPDIIAADPFIQHTCSRGSVTPYFINEDKLRGLVASLDDEIDIPVATSALYVNRMLT